jgi:hypothetical protein
MRGDDCTELPPPPNDGICMSAPEEAAEPRTRGDLLGDGGCDTEGDLRPPPSSKARRRERGVS